VSAALDPALSAAIAPPQPAGPARTRAHAATGSPAPARPFADVLRDASASAPGAVRFSKHALERVERRGIALDEATLGRLQSGVGRIAAKGARDSLVLVDGTAFVVAVPSRTVITAVGSEQMREHVFTNIDSAVIA
jgi:flagellar operon protein